MRCDTIRYDTAILSCSRSCFAHVSIVRSMPVVGPMITITTTTETVYMQIALIYGIYYHDVMSIVIIRSSSTLT